MLFRSVIGITLLAFPADWSSIAVLAILQVSENRGNFKKQMMGMMACVLILLDSAVKASSASREP